MELIKSSLSLNLSALARSSGEGLSGNVEIGKRMSLVVDADIAYALGVLSAAGANVATLSLATGIVAQTTGTPAVTDGDGKDWEGLTLPLSADDLVKAVLIVADEDNTGTVTVAASAGATAPGGILRPGGLLLLSQPDAGEVGTPTLGLTFSAGADKVNVWVFAKNGDGSV